ncbi:MAG TPA: BlaI/MecI/CopY family transcriptional regulator [Pirellulaceae bacterium]|nr:BlaI/MecI/CopY family transcriptional regulator [Pirellulaceae bacterium]
MARPKQEQPTPAELEILKVLWERGPQTVRDVMEELNRTAPERAYTTVMSLMNIMTEKGLLKRTPQGRAFLYAAKAGRDKTLGTMVNDLLGRAFAGSASALVAQLLDQATPSKSELDAIRKAINEYQNQQPGAS